jgi:hypothetical protein
MLIRDPAKRFTMKQVRKHTWMQSDVKAAEAANIYSAVKVAGDNASAAPKKPIAAINEQILRVMQSLGIDPIRTAESVNNDSYDHHAAIYFLLQDRLASTAISKPAPAKPEGSPSKVPRDHEDQIPQHQRRRPSTIAEQATLNCYNPAPQQAKDFQGLRDYNSSTATAPHPTAFTAPTIELQQQQQQQHWKTPGADQPAPGSPASISGMMSTDFTCLTCGQAILENTTSTTTCVKCARLRTRRRNFAQPWTPPPGVVLHPPSTPQPPQQTPSIEDYSLASSTVSSRSTASNPRGRNDSRDSGVSSVSSQDYDLSTPPVEKNLIFPRFPTPRTDRPSVPFSQLVRKLSEIEGITPNINPNVMGKTSLDEGVELFEDQKHKRATTLLQNVRSFEGASHSSGALAHKSMAATAATAPSSQNSSCFNSTESYPYESLDESAQTPLGPVPGYKVDPNELTQSLPSCNSSVAVPLTPGNQSVNHPSFIEPPCSDMEAIMAEVVNAHQYMNPIQQHLLAQQQHYQLVMQQQQQQLQQQQSQHGNMLTVADPTGQRNLMRSPVSFREGRRASDGLVAQAGFVAFQQRLYDKSKAHGYIELHDVHQEHKALQHQFGGSSNNSSRSGTPDSSSGGASDNKGERSNTHRRPSISKRISVPENFTYFPTATGSTGDASKVCATNQAGGGGGASALQQQLMQHRIYQKRQTLPKPTSMMLSATARRNILTRQSVLKAKPYMPQDSLSIYNHPVSSASMCGHGISNDFLFQPIAEDEADSPGSDVECAKSNVSSGMVLLSVPTCVSMPCSPTPTVVTPPFSRTPPVILMEEDYCDEVMSIDLTTAEVTLTTTSQPLMSRGSSLIDAQGSDPYWQTLPSYMAESCRLIEAECPTPPTAASTTKTHQRLNPPNKLDVTKVSPSSPCRSPILQTGSSNVVGPPPLKAAEKQASSPENMDISPK